jgi:diguanylate cyclase (GGDEF)-like protein/PAS domain S-box-containing protein
MRANPYLDDPSQIAAQAQAGAQARPGTGVTAIASPGANAGIAMHASPDTVPGAYTDPGAGASPGVGAATRPDLYASPDTCPSPEASGIERLFEMTSDLLAAISLDGRFTLLNPAWEDALGWTIEELMAQPMQARVHQDDLEQTLALTLAGRNRTAQLVNFTNRYRHKDGSWRWLLWSARCDGEVWYAAARDVTDRMWLERQALHDPLTKLPNRLLLMDRAHQALARLHRSNGPIALLFIDLDGLVSVAERLAETLRDSDTVARLGGDEFVILAEDLESDAEALAVAERVVCALEEPFEVGAIEVAMFASVGVSISRDAESDPEDLLREADVAMYRAKRRGGHRLELFDEELRREPTKRGEAPGPIRSHAPWHSIVRLTHLRR